MSKTPSLDDAIKVMGKGIIPVQKLQKWVPSEYGFSNPTKMLVPESELGSDKGSKVLDMDLKVKILKFLGPRPEDFAYEVVRRSVGMPGMSQYYLEIIFAERHTPVTRYGIGIFGEGSVTGTMAQQVLGVSGFNYTLGILGRGGYPLRFEDAWERRRHAVSMFNRTLKQRQAEAAAKAAAAGAGGSPSKSGSKSKTRSKSKSKSGSGSK